MKEDSIKIKVSKTPWSESEKSWFILSVEGEKEGSFHLGFWYPKSICKYEDGILEIPNWLFEKYFEKLETKPTIIK